MWPRYTACSVVSSLLVGLLILPLTLRAEESPSLAEKLRRLHQKLNQKQKQMERMQEKSQQRRRKLESIAEKEHGVLSLIERYNRRLRLSRRRHERRQHELEYARMILDRLKRRLREAGSKLEIHRERLRTRMRTIYKQGELGLLHYLFASRSFADFVTRWTYFRDILRWDRSIVRSYQESHRRYQDLLDRKREVHEYWVEKKREADEALEQYRRLKRSKREDLEEVRETKAFHQRRIEELQQQKRQLKNVVLDLQQERQYTKSRLEHSEGWFGNMKGRLPWPVDHHRVLRSFGTWTQDGIVHENDGVDLAVDPGSTVRSVGEGKVLYARSYSGMGEVVVVRHSRSYLTLYGSLVAVAVSEGDRVEQGTVLGRAGRTSGMDQPRLYFQIFRGKTVLNPMEWFR